MVPRRIGFLGFDGVTACHLVGPADTLAAAALDDGFGNRIPCYQICTIGLSSEKFRAESGVIFKAHKTLHTAPDVDTIVIPGGEGLRRPKSAKKFRNGYWRARLKRDVSRPFAPVSMVWLLRGYSTGAK